MSSSYSGHTAGQSDTLFGAQNKYFWHLSSLSINSNAQNVASLPGQPDTSSTGYGTEVVVDNAPCEETRAYTSDCINYTQLEALRTACLKRNATITLTDRLGFSFTGRFQTLSIQENGDSETASAFFTATINLRSIEAEASTTTRQNTNLGD